MDIKRKKTFPSGVGSRRERILLFAMVMLSATLSCGILGLSFFHARQEEQRLQMAETAFLTAFSDVAEAEKKAFSIDTALACERALIALEECSERGIHLELWRKFVNSIQKNVLEDQKLDGEIRVLLGRLSAEIGDSFRNGGDGHVALRRADAVLCSAMAEKKMTENQHAHVISWSRLPIGRRNFLQKLATRTASFLGTSAGMEEAVQAVDLSVHVMYCRNAFVMFRMRGDSFVRIVTCKRQNTGESEDDFDLESAVREYHLPFLSFSELQRYTEEGICGRVYKSREGHLLHLVKDMTSGKLAVVDLTS